MDFSKDRRLKTIFFIFFLFFPWEKFLFDHLGKNPTGIFSHRIFKIPMGFLNLSSYLKPKTKYMYVLEHNI